MAFFVSLILIQLHGHGELSKYGIVGILFEQDGLRVRSEFQAHIVGTDVTQQFDDMRTLTTDTEAVGDIHGILHLGEYQVLVGSLRKIVILSSFLISPFTSSVYIS